MVNLKLLLLGVASVSLTISEQSEKQKKMLHSILEHARKNGKPIIVSRLTPPGNAGGAENIPAFSASANMELLQSLRVRRSSLETIELPSVIDATRPSLVTGTLDPENNASSRCSLLRATVAGFFFIPRPIYLTSIGNFQHLRNLLFLA